jgi:hypothetical protein
MRLIRHGGRRVIALAALLALAVSGIAIAQAASNGPRTDRVGAVFTLERVKSNARTCQGNDGLYTEDHATYVGTSVGDPRLSGTLTIRSDSLVNQADADDGGRVTGTVEGHFRVEGDDGTLTTGNFVATVSGEAVSPTVRIEGTTDGQVRGPNHEVGGKLIGSFSATADRAGQMSAGEFGGNDDDNEQPAFIQTPSCTGPGQPVPAPAP